MKTVFLVVRDYDCEGYKISGIYTDKESAVMTLKKLNDDGYGYFYSNRIVELPLDTYFDLGDIEL